MKEYKEIPEDFNLREECKKYLEADLLSLYEVLTAYSRKVYYDLNFKQNPLDKLSLPSYAMNLYRTHFLPLESKIAKLDGVCETNVRSAYFGGRCEVFKPQGKNLTKLDVNSMYPYTMLKSMPAGQRQFTTNPNLSEIYGFSYVEWTSPPKLKYPVLPVRLEDGQCFYPLGEGKGWYYSELLKYAESLCYLIKVKHSWQFERVDNLFNSYVRKFYDLKQNANDDAERSIAKLYLNSLYGKFGTNLEPTKKTTTALSWDDLDKFTFNKSVIDLHKLDSEFILVTTQKSQSQVSSEGQDRNSPNLDLKGRNLSNANLGISVATASEAAIYSPQIAIS